MQKLPQWNAQREPYRTIAGQMNKIVDAVNANALVADSGSEMLSTSSGKVISKQTRSTRIIVEWMGVVVGAGPNGESDYSDARYWVKPSFLQQTGATVDTDAAVPMEEDATDAQIATVTNIPELELDTHELKVGAFVIVRSLYGRTSGTNATIQHVMWHRIGLQLMYLNKVGGADGDGTTAATWSYDAYSDEAMTNVVASNVPVEAPRPLPSECTPATLGIGLVIGGVFKLLYAFESFPMDPCDPPTSPGEFFSF
jgi:hypothetical protein